MTGDPPPCTSRAAPSRPPRTARSRHSTGRRCPVRCRRDGVLSPRSGSSCRSSRPSRATPICVSTIDSPPANAPSWCASTRRRCAGSRPGRPVAASGDVATTTLAASGAYAVVVPDAGATAPPAPVAGEPLPPTATPFPLPDGLTAQGSVVPPVAPASLDPVAITAQAEVVVSHAGLLPSGFVLRGDVDEVYDLRDGTSRTAPSYETFFTAYQRPGDDDPHTLHARFPLRPQVAIGPDELDEARVRVEILPVSAFEGGFFDASGGRVGTAGLLVSAPPGAVASARVVEVRSLDPSRFADLAPAGLAALRLRARGRRPAARRAARARLRPAGARRELRGGALRALRLAIRTRAARALRERRGRRAAQRRAGDGRPPPGRHRIGSVRADARRRTAGARAGPRARLGRAAGWLGSRSRSSGEPWLTFSAADGRFQLVATPGSAHRGRHRSAQRRSRDRERPARGRRERRQRRSRHGAVGPAGRAPRSRRRRQRRRGARRRSASSSPSASRRSVRATSCSSTPPASRCPRF